MASYIPEASQLQTSRNLVGILITYLNLQGNLTACLETLLSLEKQHRLGEDVTATKICCNAIVETLFLAKEWKLLNEHILLLAKRRSQLKQVDSTLNSLT